MPLFPIDVEPHVRRCDWCEKDDLYRTYHDREWGNPEYDDLALFQKLLLDGAQAGLSWHTILKKREGYYTVFNGLIPEEMATYTESQLLLIKEDARIIRNTLKIKAFVLNSQAYLRMQAEGIGFSEFLWSFVGGKPIYNILHSMQDYPTRSAESDAMSKALKKRGFTFVGSTICYAFMQAVGMYQDHLSYCWKHQSAPESID